MSASVLSYVQAPSLLCAADIALIIPSYQRPYVWPSEDVTDLLDQIIAACDAEAPHYYIGTILTSAVTQISPRGARTAYEVIDGQQRMTTLMLLALAFTAVVPSNPLAQFIILDSKPRLVFAIRDEVQRLFGDWAGLESVEDPRRSSPVDEAYLKHLAAARKALADHLNTLLALKEEEYVMRVAEYIFSKVRWVNNIMPSGMDLNRLFSTMNNSGVQLEQSDILKARLLGVIENHKLRYDAIWQACENMEDFFERNLRRVFPSADWKCLKNDDLMRYSAATFPLRNTTARAELGVSIAQLARQAVPENDEAGKKPERIRYCRPIISFSLLLMHTYRIYQQQICAEDVEVTA